MIKPAHTSEQAALLVQRIQEGDSAAESSFVKLFTRGVTFILIKETRESSIVQDLFQETFRIAIEKIRNGDIRDPRKINGFMASTARYVVIDHYRREAKHDKRANAEEPESLPMTEQSPLQRLLRQEHSQFVRKVIGDLNSERDRQLLSRFFIKGEEKAYICKVLNLTDLHFNRVLHRAKRRYRDLFLKKVGNNENM